MIESEKISLRGILSHRRIKRRVSWNLVWEWEDELSETLGIPLHTPGLLGGAMHRLASGMGIASRQNEDLEFIMIASGSPQAYKHHAPIVWVIDYFLNPDSETHAFIEATSHLKSVLISSREAYDTVIGAGGDSKRYIHVPLSVPSCYKTAPTIETSAKDIDLLLVGRASDKLEKWAQRYVADRPGIRAAIRLPRHNGHYRVVTHEGRSLGTVDTRSEYMALLRRSRLMLYSTPGLEDGKYTGGYSQVTPRLLEGVTSGCAPLMRYADNSDTRWYGLENLGPSLESYEQFAAEADSLLAMSPRILDEKLAQWVAPHYTSQVIERYFTTDGKTR